ncbi:helix-turn-helix domain-containing protein [Neisseriaceae bacterium CLB008]
MPISIKTPPKVSPKQVSADNQTINRLIGERLKTVRQQLGMSPQRVREALGMHKSNLSEWENGKKSIPIRWIVQMAEFYGVSIDYLVGSNNMPVETRTSLEVTEMLHAMGNVYLGQIGQMVGQIASQGVLKDQKINNLVDAGQELLIAMERMIDVNPEYFENEVRNGAKVQAGLERFKANLQDTKEAIKKQRLIHQCPELIVESVSVVGNQNCQQMLDLGLGDDG